MVDKESGKYECKSKKKWLYNTIRTMFSLIVKKMRENQNTYTITCAGMWVGDQVDPF